MKLMRLILLGGLIFLFLTACGPSRIRMKPEVLSDIKQDQRRVILIHYNEPQWSVLTAGMIGGAATAGVTWNAPKVEREATEKIIADLTYEPVPELEGDELIGQHATLQPSYDIQQAFYRYLSKHENLKNLYSIPEAQMDDDLSNMKQKYNNEIVLDFKTSAYLLSYYPLSWSKYRLTYAVTARMVDTVDGKVLWQAKATHIGDDSKTAPTLEEVYQNNYEGLRRLLREAQEYCLNDLIKQFSLKK